jgi:nucleoside-diphosphate-sugar epimerase
MYDFTKQTIDSYITLINPKPKFFGLRFGTVNGYSPVLRDDVMINAMVSSFWKNNKVLLFNESTKRSILGIKDLVNAIKSIINSKNAKSGIYNLASFTLTSGEIAQNVSKHLNCKLELVDPKEYNKNSINEKLISSKYNFSLCCQKFEKEFNFVFSESCDTILEDLLKYKNKMILTNRNTPFNYEG